MANSLRILRAYAASVRDAIGQGLVAALRHVVHALNVAMRVVLKAANAFRVFMETLFGKNVSGGGGVAVDTGDYEEIADDLSDADGAASGTADGLSDAADSAKKLGHDLSVLPFDELNQLNKDTEKTSSKPASGTSGTGGIGGLGDADMMDGLIDQMVGQFNDNKLPDAISAWAERVKDAFKLKDWKLLGEELAWGVNQGIEKLYKLFDTDKFKEKVTPYIDAFTETFNSLVDKIEFNKLGRTMGEGINDIVYTANRTIKKINWKNLGKKLAGGANGLVDEIKWGELGDLFANKFNMFWDIAYGFVHNFSWKQLGENFAVGSNQFLDSLDLTDVSKTLSEGLDGIATVVETFATDFKWKEHGQKFADGVDDFVALVPTAKIGDAIGLLVQGAVDGFNELFDPERGINFDFLGTKFSTMTMSAIGKLRPVSVGNLIKSIINSGIFLLKSLVTTFNTDPITEKIRITIKQAIYGIKAEDFGTAAGTLINKLASTIKGAFSLQTWAGIGTKIAESINGFITSIDIEEVTSAVRTITDGFFVMLGKAIGGIDKEKLGEKFKGLIEGIDWGTVLGMAWSVISIKLSSKLLMLSFDGIKTAIAGKLATVLAGLNPTLAPIILAIGGIAAAITGIATAIGLIKSKSNDIDTVSEDIANLQNQVDEVALSVENLDSDTTAALDQVNKNALVNKALAEPYLETLEKLASKTGELTDAEKRQKDEALDKLAEIFPGLNEQVDTHAENLGNVVNNIKSYISEVEKMAYAEVYYDRLKDAISAQVDAELALEDAHDKVSEKQGMYTEEQQKYIDLVNGWLAENGLDKMIKQEGTLAEKYKAAKEAVEQYGIKSGETGTALYLLGKQLSDMGIDLDQHIVDTLAAEEAEAKARDTVDDATKKVDKYRDAYESFTTENATSELANLEKQVGDVSTAYENAGSSADTASEKMNGFGETADSTKEKADAATEANKSVGESGEKTSGIAETLKNIFSGIASFLTTAGKGTPSSESTKDAWKEFRDTTSDELNSVAENARTEGENIGDGTVEGINSKVNDAVGAVTTMFEEMFSAAQKADDSHSPSQVYYGEGQNIVDGIVNAINDKTISATNAVEQMMGEMASTFSNELTSLKQQLETDGDSAIRDGLINGMSDSLSSNTSTITSDVNSMIDSITGAIDGSYSVLYNAGASIISAIQNGIYSMHLQLPDIWASWDRYTYGNGAWFELPSFHINWYKKGGLFTKPTLAGFGEAGDEAALPLENRKTMNRIANAIVDNSNGSFGISKADITSAVVQAMMANQNNRQPIIINAELRTENNEVLARNVIQGMERIDYRNNPTPQFG